MSTRIVRPSTSPPFPPPPPPPEVHNIAARTFAGAHVSSAIGHTTPGAADFTVGVDGTLQQILSQPTAALANKTTRIPAGLWIDNNFGFNGGPAHIYFVNKDFGNHTVLFDNGAIIRSGGAGILCYGSSRGITLKCDTPGGGKVQGDGSFPFSEGILFDAVNPNKGGDGGPGGGVTIDGLVVEPVSLSQPLMRNGIALWGGDMFVVKNCTVHDASANTEGLGGAGSGISIGVGKRRTDLVGSPRVLIQNNLIYNQLEHYDGESYDRNGIIMDIYHGWPKYTDYVVGNILIDHNVIHDVSGRGIQLLCAGLSDSLVTVTWNQVYGQWGRRLAGSAPMTGIGGYGAGVAGNVVCSDNTVTYDPGNGGLPAYWFFSFDGDGPGVFGSNNHVIGTGTPIQWEAARTNTPPAGFVT